MSTQIMPVSDLRRKTSDVLNVVRETGDAVYITQHGRPVVVLVDYERYEQLLAHVQTPPAPPTPDVAVAAEKPPYLYPTVSVPFSMLEGLIGIMPAVGGDALADTEALYDRD
ncbi:MAG TPA: type II toxin-antitoxin system Phd/YefM family antitoxin [Anaerolineae bacterium]|nr:type II toxin-antitoxin system Phd/YefM family antitoxin [Anaerolineae bacterium]HQI87202.1 type II toxin-antitoxin system Phd/YefM family antitoxin [Anaerolineae bacterium]